jgi:hypothetical protein
MATKPESDSSHILEDQEERRGDGTTAAMATS